MKQYFMCSLCRNGVLGGWLTVDEEAVRYTTGKVTVERKFRDLVLKRDEILAVSWKRVVFPVAAFEMKDGETYRFLIFNKRRFLKAYEKSEIFALRQM